MCPEQPNQVQQTITATFSKPHAAQNGGWNTCTKNFFGNYGCVSKSLTFTPVITIPLLKTTANACTATPVVKTTFQRSF
jgi:hypothetical protein